MNIPRQVASYLEGEGVATFGTDMFIGWQPRTPDNCITLYERGGDRPDPSLPLKYPNVQIIIRNKDYEAGSALLSTLRSTLHRLTNETLSVSNDYFYYLHLEQEPVHIERDENDRHEWSMNFRCKTRN